ncbi:MAG TPA: citrate/2-methylcitrate synthase [Phycisphaerales bacterium]|nr:citrate/2-methylcitrate synthase [Phycisphaerales bacterium]
MSTATATSPTPSSSPAPQPFSKGLEGIVAAETHMSFINGEKGILEYVGIAIDDLARNSTFEETVFLLWNRRLPTKAELAAFTTELRNNYDLPKGMLERIQECPKDAAPMHVLRTMVSALSMYDPDPDANKIPEARKKALAILAQTPTIIAAFDRNRRGQPFVAPKKDLSFAANFLYMLNGTMPTDAMVRAFDVCMILHADHGLNNSTFTARVIISTLSDMYSAITGAIGSLRGPLHGGANEEVMVMLGEIEEEAKKQNRPVMDYIEPFIMDRLKHRNEGARIMGFGHRVYKTIDPRATFLKTFSKQIASDTGNLKLYEMSSKIEQIMAREVGSKGIYPNVDFYSATTYHSIGLKLDLFTPMFAMSRISGWSGHILEQLDGNRLYRPTAKYVGPHGVRYVPMAER